MEKLKKAAVAAVLFAVLLLTLPVIRVSADDAVRTLFDFASDTGAFKKGDNVKEIALVSREFESGGITSRRGCLEVVGYDLGVGLIRGTTAVFSTPLDLADYRAFTYEICADQYIKDPYAEYYTRVTLYSDDGTSREAIVRIPHGEFYKVELDIGGWDGRSAVNGAEISLIINSTVKDYYEGSFFIDSVSAEGKVDRTLTDRFLFDVYTASGGRASFSEDKKLLNVALSAADKTSIDAAVFIAASDRSANSLRFKLANRTDIDTLTIYYSTLDTVALSEDKSVTIKLDKQSDSRYYYANVGDASKLKSIRIQLDSGEGTVEISSICAVSEYRPVKYTTCGSLTSCVLGADLRSIRFTGEIARDEALSNQDGKIEIYAIGGSEAVDFEKLADETPLVSSPMTTKFDISYDISTETGAVTARRFIALTRASDGTMKLIAPPFYVGNPKAAAPAAIGGKIGTKGVVSGDISLIGEVRADMTLLELNVKEAFALKNGAVRHVYDGKTYYLDGGYLSQLDGKITALRGAGVKILLRLTEWTEDLADMLDGTYAAEAYVDYSNYGSEPDGSDYFAALCAYIAGQWCTDGSVGGVILGNCVNFVDSYEKSGAALGEMAAITARSLRAAYVALISVNSEAKVYVSLSDMYSTEYSTGAEEIGLDEFLPALCSETASGGSFDWGICIDKFYRIGESRGEYIEVNKAAPLITLLRNSGFYDTRLIFCDSRYSFPKLRLGDLTAEAVKGYYSALFGNRIDCYIIVLGDGGNSEQLAETIAMLDTELSKPASDLALLMFGAKSWTELIDGYDEKLLPDKKTVAVVASEEKPTGFKGSYSYYSFDSFSGVSSFTKGYYCTGLSIKGGGKQTLRANLNINAYGSSSQVTHMGIAHRFDYPENLTLTPVLAVTLGIDSVSPSSVTEIPVKILLTADGENFEASATLTAGEMKTVYLDLSEFGMAADTKGIQLLVDGSKIRSAVLLLESINGLSREYNDESLESVIADERTRRRSPDPTHGYGVYIWVGSGIIVGVATVLTVALLSRKKGGGDE